MTTIKRLGAIFYDVETLDQLKALALRHGVTTRAFAELRQRSEKPEAVVNGGRWLLLCPVCNNGVPVDPSWTETVCIDCGSIYSIVIPDEIDAIERVLGERPIVNQNWSPGETLRALIEDNAAHGIGSMG